MTGLSLWACWLDNVFYVCCFCLCSTFRKRTLLHIISDLIVCVMQVWALFWCSLKVVLWLCCRAFWHDTAFPGFYWLICHTALCLAWFWWWPAVNVVAQFPVVALDSVSVLRRSSLWCYKHAVGCHVSDNRQLFSSLIPLYLSKL